VIEWIDTITMISNDSLRQLMDMKYPSDQVISQRRDKRYFMEVFKNSNRSLKVQENLNKLFSTGKLKDTGYLSILPVDQGVEHSGGNAFFRNPIYFDPENIVKLAIEGGCNGVVSTFGNLGIVAQKYASRIPFIVKINHNESLTPDLYQQSMFGTVKNAFDMGAIGVGATIYFGSNNSRREIREVSEAFELAHSLGMFTVLWCYVKLGPEYDQELNTSLDFTAQANYIGCSLQADIVKQKIPTIPGGFNKLPKNAGIYGKLADANLSEGYSENPVAMVRYQVLNCLGGKIPMLSNGGPSTEMDLDGAVESAVINKRAGGSGLILGRKAFQRSFGEGVMLLHEVQEIYLNREIA
jgi:class I fructose-bisphosphate aldolase